MDKLLDKIKKNLIAGRLDSQDEGADGTMFGQPGVVELIQEAIDADIPPSQILAESLSGGMDGGGRLYEGGEYLTPDMLASAECINTAMKFLKPMLMGSDTQHNGKFVIATVEGDLHDIGKNIVITLLRGAGYNIEDLGTSVQSDRIVRAVEESGANLLGLSALLTSTMGNMGEVIEKLAEKKLKDRVKVFIGGAPVTKEFAQKIGADFYCEDAFDALKKLNSLQKKD